MSKTRKSIFGIVIGLTLVVAVSLGVVGVGSKVSTALAAGLPQVTATPTAESGTSVTSKYQNFFSQTLAKNLGVTVEKLAQAIKDAFQATLGLAVKDGVITQQQADKMQAVPNNGMPFGPKFGDGFGGKGMRGWGGRGMMGNVLSLSSFAKALGVDEATLQTELNSGKSIADVAKEKNVDVAKVKAAVLADAKTTLDQQVTAGKLTQTQEDALLKNLDTKVDAVIQNTCQDDDFGGRGGFGMHMFGFGADSFAKALGMTSADLQTELQSGKSIADIATEKNVDLAKVKASVIADMKTQLDVIVKNGRMTQAQEDTMIQRMTTMLDTLVNQKGGMMMPFRHPNNPYPNPSDSSTNSSTL
jgi:hypothetical protein